jgi:hypothetical protein
MLHATQQSLFPLSTKIEQVLLLVVQFSAYIICVSVAVVLSIAISAFKKYRYCNILCALIHPQLPGGTLCVSILSRDTQVGLVYCCSFDDYSHFETICVCERQ